MSVGHEHGHDGCGCGCGGHGPAAGPASRDWRAAGPEEVVCPCRSLTKGALVEAIEGGAHTLALLKVLTGAGRGRDCQRVNPTGRSCEADLAVLVEIYGQAPAGWPSGGCGH